MDYNNLLPSPVLLKDLGIEIETRLEKVPETLKATVLDILGDIGLCLAQSPTRTWELTQADYAKAGSPHFSWPEATAAVELAIDAGLLVPSPRKADHYYPLEPIYFSWLAGRRIALTEDQDGHFDARFRGEFLEIFALAAAMTEGEGGMALVQGYFHAESPLNEVLHRDETIAMRAVAWGAPVDPETELTLVQTAFAWLSPNNLGSDIDSATALLCAVATQGSLSQEVRIAAEQQIEDALEALENDPDLNEHPGVDRALDAVIAILVAISQGDTTVLAPYFDRLGALHASRVARAIPRVWPPSDGRNTFIDWATQLALEAGDLNAFTAYGSLIGPKTQVVGVLHTLFRKLLDAPEDETLIYVSLGAVQSLMAWDECGELTLHLVGRILLSPTHPDLRIAAAALLAQHPEEFAKNGDVLLSALQKMLHEPDVMSSASAAAGLLYFEPAQEVLTKQLLALPSSGMPPTVLADALAHAFRSSPTFALLMGRAWEGLSEDEAFYQALTLESLAESCLNEYLLGPWFTGAPLSDDARNSVVGFLMSVIASRPDSSVLGVAAGMAARIAPDDAALFPIFKSLLDQADDHERRGLILLTLGVLRHPEVLPLLLHEAAYGHPEDSASALRAAAIHFDALEGIELPKELFGIIEQRSNLPGPQNGPGIAFLERVYTVPVEARPPIPQVEAGA